MSSWALGTFAFLAQDYSCHGRGLLCTYKGGGKGARNKRQALKFATGVLANATTINNLKFVWVRRLRRHTPSEAAFHPEHALLSDLPCDAASPLAPHYPLTPRCRGATLLLTTRFFTSHGRRSRVRASARPQPNPQSDLLILTVVSELPTFLAPCCVRKRNLTQTSPPTLGFASARLATFSTAASIASIPSDQTRELG